MTLDNKLPEGALYFNGFYPGYLAVPANTAYTVRLGAMDVLLHVVRHVQPVVVTDFANRFAEDQVDGKSFTRLLHEIPMQPRDIISVDVQGPTGQPETLFFATKEHSYRLYRRQTFTEITVGAEVPSLENPGLVNPRLWHEACARFLSIYRVVSIDVSVIPPARLRRNVPIIRQRAVRYGRIGPGVAKEELLLRAIPASLEPIIFSYREFELDMPRLVALSEEKVARIGHHLAVGTLVPDVQEGITNAFETLVEQDNPRFALIDVFSLAEVVCFDLLNRLRQHDQKLDGRLVKRERDGDLSIRTVISPDHARRCVIP